MDAFALHGDHIWSENKNKLCFMPNAYSICLADGSCGGVFAELPAQYSALPVRELGGQLIIPGFSDLHLHAPQYRDMGLGMDLTLLDWLTELTFPEEAKFRSEEYAHRVYEMLTQELRRSATTRAVVFSSAHTRATEILMELMESSGLYSFVGRVNMDRNAPDDIREPDAAYSLRETEAWLRSSMGRFSRTFPIITPRFVPVCTPEVMAGLAALAEKHALPVQSHLGETPEELAWVRRLCPEDRDYASVYERFGLLTEKTVMAHCVYLTEDETDLVRKRGCFIAHCPDSNTNIRSGIAPIRRYIDRDMHVGLGTDISGGHTLDMFQTIRQTLAVSRLLWRLDEAHPAQLSAEEAFYLATAGGGAFFGKVGAFIPGYRFDAVAVDDSRWSLPADDMRGRFERMIYRASAENITAKYVDGQSLF